MNIKRWLLASLAVLVVIGVVGFVTNEILLKDIYMQTASVWRPMPELMSMMWMMWIGHAIFALMFVLIYIKGYEKNKSGIGQGLRYGIYLGLLAAVAPQFIWYVVLPIPGILAVYWAVSGMVQAVLAGAAVGAIYKK
jgi:hypothetical protein